MEVCQKHLNRIDEELSQLPYYDSHHTVVRKVDKQDMVCQTSRGLVNSPFRKLMDQIIKLENQIEDWHD